MERQSDKKIMAIVALVVGTGAVLCAFIVGGFLFGRTESVDIILGDGRIAARVADSSAEHTRGLSGTDSLKDDQGMLFVFGQDDRHAIWMKDMKYPLDILWVDAEKKIVHIERAISPATYPQAFGPPSPARYVIELPSGYADRHRLHAGQSVIFNR